MQNKLNNLMQTLNEMNSLITEGGIPMEESFRRLRELINSQLIELRKLRD
jgi:hypothetical protein